MAAVADFIGIHESTASRIIAKVSRILASLYVNFVKFPTREEVIVAQTDFHEIALFPRVVDALDGTHVKIQSPGW